MAGCYGHLLCSYHMANGLEVEIEALEKLIEAGEVKTGDQVSSVCRWQLVQPN